MTAGALQCIVLCCIKSVPTLMEKYDKKIFFVLTDLGMLQRPYSFLFSFAFLCQQQQMQKKKYKCPEEHLGNIRMHIISKIIQSVFGFPPEQLLSCVPLFSKIQILGSSYTCLYRCFSHPLSHSVSIITSLCRQKSLPCFTHEELKLKKGK